MNCVRAGPRTVSSGSLLHGLRRSFASSVDEVGGGEGRTVILGSGWAGYALARTLAKKNRGAECLLVSPRSHFVFTPLLASAAVGTLEFRCTVESNRRLGVPFHQAWCSGVDFARKTIRLEASSRDGRATRSGSGPAPSGTEFEVPYGKLVIAVGCHSQTFGVEGVKEHACFLRDAGDARIIRLKVLQAFERAALPGTDDAERKRLLHFAVVGGGPTGIEVSAEMHDLIHDDLSKLYPALMRHVNITVYDIAPKVLPMFDESLSNYTRDMFRRQGIKIKTEHQLQRIRREGDYLMLRIREEPDEVAAGVVVWSTGLKQNPLVERLVQQDIDGFGHIVKDAKTGGITVDQHLRVLTESKSGSGSEGAGERRVLPDVFAIGDCSVVEGAHYPATAQVANQQAVDLGRRLNKGAVGDETFKFRDWGAMAYLGSWRAIHQKGSEELKGRAGFLLWRSAYFTKSMSYRNKILIPVYWFITWLFGRDISRF